MFSSPTIFTVLRITIFKKIVICTNLLKYLYCKWRRGWIISLVQILKTKTAVIFQWHDFWLTESIYIAYLTEDKVLKKWRLRKWQLSRSHKQKILTPAFRDIFYRRGEKKWGKSAPTILLTALEHTTAPSNSFLST